jgi:DNA-binding MarR family transcriptional regulator
MNTKRKVVSVDEGNCHCTALRKASRRISQMYDTTLAPSGMKTTQRAILAQIHRSEPVSVSVLAEALVMDAGGLAHTLKPLDRDGFVEISIDPNDRRGRVVSLTPAGRAKLKETDRLWKVAQRSFETACGRVESASLREAMRQLISDEFTEAFEQTFAK